MWSDLTKTIEELRMERRQKVIAAFEGLKSTLAGSGTRVKSQWQEISLSEGRREISVRMKRYCASRFASR